MDRLLQRAGPAVDPRLAENRYRGFFAVSATSLLPVDRVFLLFNLLVAIALLPLGTAEPTARVLIAAHLLALALPAVLVRLGGTQGPLSLLRELYPLLALPVFWLELGVRYPWIETHPNDLLIAGAEATLFGVQPSIEWARATHASWVRELMHACYAAYYPLLVGVPLAVLATRRRAAARALVLRMSLTYLGCFLVYTLFPVVGPRHFFPGPGPAAGESLFLAVNAGIQSAGDSLGTAFPSSHVAGSLTLAIVAWRWCGGAVAWASVIAAAGMTIAVVYTGNHFAVDAMAAVVLVVGMHGVAAPALEGRTG